jgi:hypothetical protein
MKSIVTISRHWNNPKIETTISKAGIVLKCELGDFVSALKAEMGSVTWVFTKQEFEKRLDKAIETVLSGIKEESAKVI